MKHTRAITRRPAPASTNFQALKDFLVNLTEQIIQAIFQLTD